MSGVRLLELQASDMLDVIHYIFEDDALATTAEHGDAKDRFRIAIYEGLYGQSYDYGSTVATYLPDAPEASHDYGDVPPAFNARGGKTKAYIPPTKFNESLVNPYEGVLDAPLG